MKSAVLIFLCVLLTFQYCLLSTSSSTTLLASAFLPSSCICRKVLRCSKPRIYTISESQPFQWSLHLYFRGRSCNRKKVIMSNGRCADTSCGNASNMTKSLTNTDDSRTNANHDVNAHPPKSRNRKTLATGKKAILRVVEELGHLRGPLSPRRSTIGSPGDVGSNCTRRLYQYILRARLHEDNVKQVLQFLNTLFPTNPSTISELLTFHPRILRRSVEYQLQPVVKFLRNLYGEQLFHESLRRNPSLLLVSGVGFFNSRQHDNSLSVERFFQDDLNMPRYLFDQLNERHPFILHIPLDRNIRPLVSFLACLLTQQDYYQSKSEQYGQTLHTLDDTIKRIIVRVISNYPTILSLTLDGNLYPTVEFLRKSCFMEERHLANMVRNCPQILGLSVEDNLSITLDLIARSFGLNTPRDFQRCLGRHPQILCLSLENLYSKVVFFHSLDKYNDDVNADSDQGVEGILEELPTIGCNPSSPTSAISLMYRLAVNAPSVYSLSLRDNIIPKLVTLAKVWCVDQGRSSLEASLLETLFADYDVAGTTIPLTSLAQRARTTLSKRLKDYPAILTFSHDAKIIPTLQFLNRTGYLNLDASGYAQGTGNSTRHHHHVIPGRYLAASLYTRLLPRWHYIQHQKQQLLQPTHLGESKNKAQSEIQAKVLGHPPPLHILALSTDLNFCSYFNFSATSFYTYKEDAIPKLKFTTQFEIWIRTGAPIDIIG